MRSRSSLILLATVALVACGGTPAAPSTTSTSQTVTAVQLPACSSWAGTLRASGVSAPSSTVATQRDAFYADGGGVKAVGSKYYAAWFPSGWASTSPRRLMLDLHGTGGAPETEWATDWSTIFKSRNWAYVGLKYVNDATGVHDDETTIYANIKTLVTDIAASCDFGSPSMFLVGFSRGSAEAFPIAYLDIKDRRYFSAIGNNSGAWVLGGPLTVTMQGIVDRGETNAYAGTRFWMYCGGLDDGHGYPMCDEMANARTFVTTYGGTVERLYEDPTGGHGGLAKNADAWGAMFTYFESLR